MLTALALLALPAAQAACPADVTIHDALTCSSSYAGFVDHEEDSYLGGSCDDSLCYTCGEPYANEPQYAPEAVYSFTCQLAGTVTMLITDLTCDLDIYVLDDSCSPSTGCVMGSTASYAVDDQVTFDCTPGQTYYIVVEAYGTQHLDVASGPCTDDGTATGTVYSPTYTLSFDVSASTGCAEDCDDGLDNDLDGDIDCDDADCWVEDLCCDTDGDGHRAEGDCGGDDCDDTDPTVYPGAPEDGGTGTDGGDGKDNDCDGTVDEGTLDYDDDGDGWTERRGDCDDGDASVNPDATDTPDDGIDQDCDGQDAHEPEDTEQPEDTDDGATDDSQPADDTGEDGGKDDGFGVCGCAAAPAGPLGALAAGLLILGAAVRRRG
ncbi:MAG: putative metal-binding motif-containing protein [Pseudomonadota bacterium]